MSVPDNILILTEAGNTIGFGHYMRCAAVLDSMQQHGIDCRMLLVDASCNPRPWAKEIRVCDWLENTTALETYARRFRTVVVDSYLATKNHLARINQIFDRVVVIDDYNRLDYPADLVINPNIYGAELNYGNQSARVAGGAGHVILRRAFRDNRRRFTVKRQLTNIIVTLGGHDQRGLIPALIDLLNATPCRYHIVSGSEKGRQALVNLPDGKGTLHGFMTADQMVSMMLAADVAISAAGQTLNELSSLGVPTIAVCMDLDQELNIQSYVSRQILPDLLFWNDADLMAKIKRTLMSLSAHARRQEMSTKARALIDGGGIDRNCALIRSLSTCCHKPAQLVN